MKKLIKYLLSISLMCFLGFIITSITVSAEELAYGYDSDYSNWSTEPSGKEGEKTKVFYRSADVLSWDTSIVPEQPEFYKEVTQYGYHIANTYGSRVGSKPSGYYYYSTSTSYTWSGCTCSWNSIYGQDSGISCWEDGAGWTTKKCTTKTPVTTYNYYPVSTWKDAVWNSSTSSNNPVSAVNGTTGTPKEPLSRTAYVEPASWDDWTEWQSESMSKTTSRDVQVTTFYSYSLRTSVGDKPTTSVVKTCNGSVQNNGYTIPSGVIMTGDNSGTNAGIYTATYTPDSNHKWSDGTYDAVTVTLTINKATPELTFEDETITIGFDFEGTKKITPATGNKGPLTYKLGAQKKGTENVSYFSISGTTLNIRDNTPAGTYTLSITATDAGNSSYNSASKTKTVTLILKSVIVKFDGNGHTAGQMEDFLPSVTYYKTGYTFVGWKAPDITKQTPSTALGDYPSDVVYSKDNKYYYNNSLAEGLLEGKEYTSGELTNGTKNDKEYSYGELLNGFKDRKLYVDGVLFTGSYGSRDTFYEDEGLYYFNEELANSTYYGIKYVNGEIFTGIEDSKYYKDGILATGNYNGYYYENGVQQFELNTSLTALMSDIENAVREKTGKTEAITLEEIASIIRSIELIENINHVMEDMTILSSSTSGNGNANEASYNETTNAYSMSVGGTVATTAYATHTIKTGYIDVSNYKKIKIKYTTSGNGKYEYGGDTTANFKIVGDNGDLYSKTITNLAGSEYIVELDVSDVNQIQFYFSYYSPGSWWGYVNITSIDAIR